MLKKVIVVVLLIFGLYYTYYVFNNYFLINELEYIQDIRSDTAETYTACGCGCCGGEATVEECIYREKGVSLEEIRASDRLASQRPLCANVGCSIGTLYKYCD